MFKNVLTIEDSMLLGFDVDIYIRNLLLSLILNTKIFNNKI